MFGETEQRSESDSDMSGLLELSHQEFFLIMINRLRILLEKEDNM